MSRGFRCRECGELREAATKTGPLPSVCDVCDPERAAAREAARARATRKVTVSERDLRRRVRLLVPEDEIADRRLVTRQVRRVAMAEGCGQTREALLDLAAAAIAWEQVLTAPGDEVLLHEPVEDLA